MSAHIGPMPVFRRKVKFSVTRLSSAQMLTTVRLKAYNSSKSNTSPEIPHNGSCLDVPGQVWVAVAALSLLSFSFFLYSWCVAEGCGRHSYNENKEVGSGQGKDRTIPGSVYLSLPQAWCQWTTGKNEVCPLACSFYKIVSWTEA